MPLGDGLSIRFSCYSGSILQTLQLPVDCSCLAWQNSSRLRPCLSFWSLKIPSKFLQKTWVFSNLGPTARHFYSSFSDIYGCKIVRFTPCDLQCFQGLRSYHQAKHYCTGIDIRRGGKWFENTAKNEEISKYFEILPKTNLNLDVFPVFSFWFFIGDFLKVACILNKR